MKTWLIALVVTTSACASYPDHRAERMRRFRCEIAWRNRSVTAVVEDRCDEPPAFSKPDSYRVMIGLEPNFPIEWMEREANYAHSPYEGPLR